MRRHGDRRGIEETHLHPDKLGALDQPGERDQRLPQTHRLLVGRPGQADDYLRTTQHVRELPLDHPGGGTARVRQFQDDPPRRIVRQQRCAAPARRAPAFPDVTKNLVRIHPRGRGEEEVERCGQSRLARGRGGHGQQRERVRVHVRATAREQADHRGGRRNVERLLRPLQVIHHRIADEAIPDAGTLHLRGGPRVAREGQPAGAPQQRLLQPVVAVRPGVIRGLRRADEQKGRARQQGRRDDHDVADGDGQRIAPPQPAGRPHLPEVGGEPPRPQVAPEQSEVQRPEPGAGQDVGGADRENPSAPVGLAATDHRPGVDL